MKTTTIRQTATIPATPKEVYNAIMSSAKHSAFTGEKAIVGKKIGDSYSAYGGYISGKNVELIPAKKIVQTWVAMEEHWPEGHESLITFRLAPKGTSTLITFTHENIPEVIARNFVSGWKNYYWTPLKMYFSKK